MQTGVSRNCLSFPVSDGSWFDLHHISTLAKTPVMTAVVESSAAFLDTTTTLASRLNDAVTLYDADRLLDASRALEQALAGVPLAAAEAALNQVPKASQIRSDAAEVFRILQDMDSDDRWIRCYSGPNTCVDYRPEPHCDSHTMRAQGVLHAPLKNVAVLLNEPDLFPDLFWFVRRAEVRGQKGRFKRAADLTLYAPPPLSNRDVVLYGYAVDALDSDNCVMVVTRDRCPSDGFAESDLDSNCTDLNSSECIDNNSKCKEKGNKSIIRESSSWGGVQAIVYYAMFELRPLSPDVTRVRLIANSDPKLPFVPMFLVNWGSRMVMRFALRMLEAKACNIESLPHANRLSNPVYEWIENRLLSYWQTKDSTDQQHSESNTSRNEDIARRSFDFDESTPEPPSKFAILSSFGPYLARKNSSPWYFGKSRSRS